MADYLRECTKVELVDDCKILATLADSHLFYCDRPEKRDLLSRTAQELAGKPVQVKFCSDGNKAHRETAPSKINVSNRELFRQSQENDLVQRAVNLFDAKVLRVVQRSKPSCNR